MYELYRGTMIIGCRFICVSVFAVLINKVSLQVPKKAVIGGSVVLPCSSTEHGLKAQDTDVHWRHNGSENVYEIIKGKDSVERQDPWYKNRVETLPFEYERGNFSIKLNNLTHGDAGEFSCLITHSSEFLTVQLIIKEKESKSTEQENQPEENASDNVDKSLNWVSIVIIALLLLIIVCIGIFILFYLKKKNSAASFSCVRT